VVMDNVRYLFRMFPVQEKWPQLSEHRYNALSDGSG
jgi:hypothetical protein